MGTYERKVNQLKDLMRRKYKSAYNKSKEMDIDISSRTQLAPLVYIYMIGNGRKDTGKYAAPFGKCATII